MSNISSISYNLLMKRTIQNYSSIKSFSTLCILKFDTAQFADPIFPFVSAHIQAHDPSAAPGKSPPPDLAEITNVLEFDTVPTEKPTDPPPSSPGPNPGPEFPGPPSPSPPVPESPRPPMPSPPGGPEIFPPNGPDMIPPMPPEPVPSNGTKPDVGPPIMGSDGLVFY